MRLNRFAGSWKGSVIWQDNCEMHTDSAAAVSKLLNELGAVTSLPASAHKDRWCHCPAAAAARQSGPAPSRNSDTPSGASPSGPPRAPARFPSRTHDILLDRCRGAGSRGTGCPRRRPAALRRLRSIGERAPWPRATPAAPSPANTST